MQKGACHGNGCFLCRNCLPEWRELNLIKKDFLVFKKGKKIFREADKVEGIFFIYHGSVKVTKSWGEQKELLLRFAKEGDVLGHRGFGGNLHYPISATALEDTQLCFIHNDFLEASLKANTALAYHLMQVYAQELQKAEHRMRDLVHMEVKGRIVLALFEISEIFGTSHDDYISLPITRQDIASYAGTSYETVFKFFADLSAKNILTTSGKNIRINDPHALKAFVKAHG